ncbi:MAG: hypothetical protein ACTJFV_08465, partial [Moraxellaceae bacterium]
AEHDHAEHDHAEHDHAEHDHAEHDHAEHDHAEHDHAEHDHAEHDHAEHDHAEHDHAGHDHAGHHHGSSGTPFSCEPDNTTIAVHYHNDSNPQEAHLLIDGLEYDVTATSDSEDSSEQKTYVSDIGLDDTHGIIWQVNGDNATLFSKTLDSNVAIEDEDILFNCQPS